MFVEVVNTRISMARMSHVMRNTSQSRVTQVCSLLASRLCPRFVFTESVGIGAPPPLPLAPYSDRTRIRFHFEPNMHLFELCDR